MRIPDRHKWRGCRYAGKERACLSRKISPVSCRERDIRACDACSIGTQRARALAMHARRVDARILGAA